MDVAAWPRGPAQGLTAGARAAVRNERARALLPGESEHLQPICTRPLEAVYHDRSVAERSVPIGRPRVMLNHKGRIRQVDVRASGQRDLRNPVAEHAILQGPARKAGLLWSARARLSGNDERSMEQLIQVGRRDRIMGKQDAQATRHGKGCRVDHWPRREIRI
eukprot:6539955-Prymnesium_polylepis.2